MPTDDDFGLSFSPNRTKIALGEPGVDDGNVSSVNPLPTSSAKVDASADDVNVAGADDTDAVITYTAIEGEVHVITGIAWGYTGGDPTGGLLTVEDDTDVVFSLPITAEGAGLIVFPRPKAGSDDSDMVITLAAGGGGVTGHVNVLNHWTEAV